MNGEVQKDSEAHRYACEVRTVAKYPPRKRKEYFEMVAKSRGAEYLARIKKDVLETMFDRDVPGQA